MQISFESMTPEEIDQILRDAAVARDKAIAKRREDLKRQILGHIEKAGFRIEDVLDFKSRRSTYKRHPFRNALDPKQTWSGKGRPPRWYKAQLGQQHKAP